MRKNFRSLAPVGVASLLVIFLCEQNGLSPLRLVVCLRLVRQKPFLAEFPMSQLYRHSNKFTPHGLVAGMLAGIAAAIPGGFLYVYGIWSIPEAKLRGVCPPHLRSPRRRKLRPRDVLGKNSQFVAGRDRQLGLLPIRVVCKLGHLDSSSNVPFFLDPQSYSLGAPAQGPVEDHRGGKRTRDLGF